jgi:flavin reductase (DIM6/NTAB) family NADH-FMN oxidoreductase RutF
MSHDLLDPAILYFGTPVVLLGTADARGTINIAPMSSVFWLGHTAVIGMGGGSQSTRNLLETGECVLNLPGAEQVSAVDRLALTTGRRDVSPGRAARGYRYEPDKFGLSELTPVPALTLSAPRVAECPVQLEGAVVSHHPLGGDQLSSTVVFHVAVRRVHVDRGIRMAGTANRIDPDRWRPIIMSFQRFYGLGAELHPSRLASIPEELYR